VLNLNQDIKDVVVSEAEYKRLLGFPDDFIIAESDQHIVERMDKAKEWFNLYGKPWTFTKLIEDFEIADDHIEINGVKFISSVLRDKMKQAKAHAVVLVAMSAGSEAEARAGVHWKENEPDDYFFLEMYASGVVEALVTQVGAQLCGWAEQHGNKVLPHYSPGYVGWDIEDQKSLFNLFQNGNKHLFSDRLEMLSTGMLKPKKSLIGLFGITRKENVAAEVNSLIPCEQCSLSDCTFRRLPFIPPEFTIEGNRIANEVIDGPDGSHDASMALVTDGDYAYSKKALKKWNKNHLTFERSSDGSIEAIFKFEGSTCSNAGVEIKYDYKLSLSSPKDGCEIKAMQCRPSGKDDGYTFQCPYITKGDAFLKEIDDQKPLLGQPLDEALSWEPDIVPSGCLCGEESRNHKWKIVLQSLHYGIVNE